MPVVQPLVIPYPIQPVVPCPRGATTLSGATTDLDSGQLLRGQREVVIRHGDQLYRLRHTRNDKLILTK